MHRPSIKLAPTGAALSAALALTACGSVVDHKPNLIAGKDAFQKKCGSCHILARAGTKGIQGPNLDEAFRQSLADGIERSTVRGVVARQIEEPNRAAQVDPATEKELIVMPKDLVKGQELEDVAAYVASAVSKSGEDPGRLASVGKITSKGTAKEAGGKLDIPANPDGQLAYEYADAEATAGQVTIESKNDSSTGHNIAVEGNGLSTTAGKIVQGGAVSSVQVTLKPGTYTFFCTVPGHRAGGMEGKITVK
ncbi:MAG: hypothetical protein QOF76_792 [Solirubrobacteraceae bacterium]|nr:hypothetical protein [Solirubrobacteraceae bacterium]